MGKYMGGFVLYCLCAGHGPALLLGMAEYIRHPQGEVRRFAFVQSPHLPFRIRPSVPPTTCPSLWTLGSSTPGPSTCRPGSGSRLLAAWCLWPHPTCLCTLVPFRSATVPLSTAVPPLSLLFLVRLPSVRVPGSLADLPVPAGFPYGSAAAFPQVTGAGPWVCPSPDSEAGGRRPLICHFIRMLLLSSSFAACCSFSSQSLCTALSRPCRHFS